MLPPNEVSALSIIVIKCFSDLLGVVGVTYKFHCVLKSSKVRRHFNCIKASNLLKTVVSLVGS
jgi:hypothetical protein